MICVIGVSVLGVSVQGVSDRGVCVLGGTCPGGFCPVTDHYTACWVTLGTTFCLITGNLRDP